MAEDVEEGPLMSEDLPKRAPTLRTCFVVFGLVAMALVAFLCRGTESVSLTALQGKQNLAPMLEVRFGSRCMGVDPNQVWNGGVVQLRPCDGMNTKWQQTDIRCTDSTCRAQTSWKLALAQDPSLCLDVRDHLFQDGTPLQLWSCGYDDEDQVLQSERSDQSRLQWKDHSNFYVDVKDGSAIDWQPVQIWSRGQNQHFVIM